MSFQDIPEIFQGFKNFIFSNKTIEESAEAKARFCFECPVRDGGKCSKQKSGKVVTTFKYKKSFRIEGDEYKGCGCNLELKLRSNSKCPLGKF